jgi:hypothetical protein
MSAPEPLPFATEPTPEGEQALVPGVTPITLAERLAWRAAQPLAPVKAQRPCDLGLFDVNGRAQLELFAARPSRPGMPPDPDELPPPEPGGG